MANTNPDRRIRVGEGSRMGISEVNSVANTNPDRRIFDKRIVVKEEVVL